MRAPPFVADELFDALLVRVTWYVRRHRKLPERTARTFAWMCIDRNLNVFDELRRLVHR